ncbi:hypothetical protein E2C01_075868 [Portunus trituberculatus]|uniref:Uncharacterized protein n=1 Tax=Portunus trituberculatus TaxID=210409 RepID=A0A5B7I798_PORTR|nr:hypothetical protein [Portunus trituberculatus]
MNRSHGDTPHWFKLLILARQYVKQSRGECVLPRGDTHHRTLKRAKKTMNLLPRATVVGSIMNSQPAQAAAPRSHTSVSSYRHLQPPLTNHAYPKKM